MISKRGQFGFPIRLVAGTIMTISLPFLIFNPSNPFALIAFSFGGFLMVIGGITP